MEFTVTQQYASWRQIYRYKQGSRVPPFPMNDSKFPDLASTNKDSRLFFLNHSFSCWVITICKRFLEQLFFCAKSSILAFLFIEDTVMLLIWTTQEQDFLGCLLVAKQYFCFLKINLISDFLLYLKCSDTLGEKNCICFLKMMEIRAKMQCFHKKGILREHVFAFYALMCFINFIFLVLVKPICVYLH